MSELWNIIGLSSLVASVVTVILGIIRDILIEKYRFRRQSEAGFIQSQIKLYSQIYFLLQRIQIGATAPQFFSSIFDDMKELNDIIKANSSLLTPTIIGKWLAFMVLIKEIMEEKKTEKREELGKKAREHSVELLSIIKEMMNSNLIPKYRKIVGETVPVLT